MVDFITQYLVCLIYGIACSAICLFSFVFDSLVKVYTFLVLNFAIPVIMFLLFQINKNKTCYADAHNYHICLYNKKKSKSVFGKIYHQSVQESTDGNWKSSSRCLLGWQWFEIRTCMGTVYDSICKQWSPKPACSSAVWWTLLLAYTVFWVSRKFSEQQEPDLIPWRWAGDPGLHCRYMPFCTFSPCEVSLATFIHAMQVQKF